MSNKFKKYMHTPTGGGKPVEVDIGYERFLGPEMFFHPVSILYINNIHYNYICYYRNSSVKILKLH